MPIYEYKCKRCGHISEVIVPNDSEAYRWCRSCSDWEVVFVPSVTGYRRDHTIHED